MSSLKAYPSYRPINELWLTNIPLNWDNRKIKYLFQERNEKGYPNEPLLAATQNKGVVPKEIYGNRTVEATKDLHLLKLVRVGDFVISLRSFQGGIEKAYYQGIISPAYTVMTPNEFITEGYFKHLAKSKPFIELLQMCVTGIREGQNVDYQKLKNAHIPIPSREEQDQIVKYLDNRLAKIAKFIKTKKKQIALLKEQKQAIINHAVTKGLDHNAKMKSSGIEWLGDIPEGWEELRIKNCIVSLTNGIWGSEPCNNEKDIVCVRVADFKMDDLTIADDKLTIRNIEISKNLMRLLNKGDILVEKSGGGENQPVGRVVLFNKDYTAVCSNFIAKISINKII